MSFIIWGSQHSKLIGGKLSGIFINKEKSPFSRALWFHGFDNRLALLTSNHLGLYGYVNLRGIQSV